MVRFNFDKFANAVLLVLDECESRPGLTVLVKLIFRADFEHYRAHLRSITGVEYEALERGPVPQDYRALFRKLVSRGDVGPPELVEVGSGYKPMERYTALRKPNLDAFNPEELAVLRKVIATDGRKSGAQLSAKTHDEPPWKFVWQDGEGEGQPIPYALARWEDNRCTPDDLAVAAKDLQDPEVQQALAEFAGGR